MSQKPIRETAIGGWLKEKAPKALDLFGDMMPDRGLLGVIGKVVDNISETPEDRDQAHRHLQEMYAAEVADRDSARKRQTGMAQSNKADLMFSFTGVIGLLAFAFIVYAIVYLEIPSENKEVWIHLIGICEGIVLSIFGYFYGSAHKKD
jgi:hypothetical protein